jgi:hypothetical protein
MEKRCVADGGVDFSDLVTQQGDGSKDADTLKSPSIGH